MLLYRWKSFDLLSPQDVYDMLSLRQQIFIIEQQCIYPDIDYLDQKGWHLLGYDKSNQLIAYLRVLPAGVKFTELSMGRVLINANKRNAGHGAELLKEGLSHIDATLSNQAIRISAQIQLQGFYADFGFKATSKPYDEDGIPHIEMLRAPQ